MDPPGDDLAFSSPIQSAAAAAKDEDRKPAAISLCSNDENVNQPAKTAAKPPAKAAAKKTFNAAQPVEQFFAATGQVIESFRSLRAAAKANGVYDMKIKRLVERVELLVMDRLFAFVRKLWPLSDPTSRSFMLGLPSRKNNTGGSRNGTVGLKRSSRFYSCDYR